MPGKGLICFCLNTLLLGGLVLAQEPLSLPLWDEDFLYRGESKQVPHIIFENQADLLSHPIRLNTATPEQLEESGLFTPYQIHHLIRYRDQYGDLYTIFELTSLPGFRKSRVLKIAPYLSLETGRSKRVERKKKHMILINLGKVLPEADGYRVSTPDGSDPAYKGNSFKSCLRIKSHLGRNISMGLTYEKDPGEAFLVGTKPEFLSAYVQYNGNRLLRQFVLGNYKLNHGLGLVHGSGFMHSPENISINWQSLSVIRPYSSKSEYGFERGAALRMEKRNTSLLCWFSHRPLDLSTNQLKSGSVPVDWREYIRNTGLHRTTGELKGRDLALRLNGGAQALYKHKQLRIGMAFSMQSTGLSKAGIKTLAMANQAVLSKQVSMHGTWFWEGWQVFGEIALSNWESLALLSGLKWDANDFLKGMVLFHHYGREYGGSLPSAYASGSKIENETGLAVYLHLEPGRLVQVDFTGELFYYPGPRHLTLVPSYGQRYRLRLGNGTLSKFQWKIGVLRKLWQSTPEHSLPGPRPLRTSDLTRLDIRVAGFQVVQWQSRLLLSFLKESQTSYPAYAAAQQFSYQVFKQVNSALQFVVFDVQDWSNRFYLYEPGVYYSFNFPSLYGCGQKTTLVLSLKVLEKLSLASKIAFTVYRHKKNLGTANDLIPGNKKWSVEMQARLNL
jgi:hypothetical protein